jgi:hypothetical protein
LFSEARSSGARIGSDADRVRCVSNVFAVLIAIPTAFRESPPSTVLSVRPFGARHCAPPDLTSAITML